MFEAIAWMATHPFGSEEANIMFWLCVIAAVLIGLLVTFFPSRH